MTQPLAKAPAFLWGSLPSGHAASQLSTPVQVGVGLPLQVPPSPAGPRPPWHPRPRAGTARTIICATSSAFCAKWKQPPCALLQMAWQTMHTLCTRHSFRAGSWRDSGLQGAANALPPSAALS